MPHVLAIDQSTSATKAVLYDATTLAQVDGESLAHKQIYPAPGLVRHDAAEIWRNVLAVARTLLARHSGVDLACLSLTNQRETFVIFDRTTGTPLHDAVVWQCRSGTDVCAALADRAAELRRKTGLQVDTYFSGPKLKQLFRDRPDLRDTAASGRAIVGTIDAYLVHRLTRGKTFATDATNASRTLLYDLNTRSWDADLCRTFDVPMNALPTVLDSDGDFGATDLDGLLPKPIPIRGVIGDSQASLFAQQCYEPGTAKATFGTGTSILLNVGPTPPDVADTGGVGTLGWTLSGKPTYAVEGIINYSAATIAWLRDNLGLIANAAESEALAESIADTGGVYLVPAFAGLSAPHWKPLARAAIVGLTGGSTRAHVVRAGLEAIAYQIRDVVEMMRGGPANVGLTSLHADGGPTANRWLMQFVADVVGTPLKTSTIADGSALGAAMIGTLAVGLHASPAELAKLPRDWTTYSPQMPRDRADALHADWQRAVRQVLAESA